VSLVDVSAQRSLLAVRQGPSASFTLSIILSPSSSTRSHTLEAHPHRHVSAMCDKGIVRERMRVDVSK
jgi:hypothetical protein